MKQLWLIFLGAAVVAGSIWLYQYVSSPAPGQRVSDMGREHVSAAQVAATAYNSNPPTSGPHLPTWVKPGIYQVPQSEGELIHLLEHGYVIISYNCGVHLGENPKSETRNPKQIQISKSRKCTDMKKMKAVLVRT